VVDRKQNILIVEDDVDVAEMLDAYFRVKGYEVETVNWGEDAFEACRKNLPDLVILDIRLPDIDGYEVARRLRATRRTKDVPIIFLTEKRGRSDKLQGLEFGVEDYITKPFDIQELRLRVKNALQRSSQGAINNPITGLPQGALVDECLSECLDSNDWALIIVSIQNLNNFRETYGFVASDDVIRAISLMVQNSVRKGGNINDFVGHINPAKLVILTQPSQVDNITSLVESRLNQSLEYFYPLEDRNIKFEALKTKLALRMHVFLPDGRVFKNIDALKKSLFKY
jgi:PleD family two-component response regulator